MLKLLDYIRKFIFFIVDTAKRRSLYNVGREIVDFNGERLPTINRIKELKKQIDFPMLNCEAYNLIALVKQTNKISGDVAEVGCFNGGSTRLIGESKGSKSLHVFDTFAGLPSTTEEDGGAPYTIGQYSASLESVRQVMEGIPGVFFYKGFFPGTVSPVAGKKFSFVHLDVDLYQATHDSLVFFYPRMSRGGVVISHDYNGCPGVKKAFDDFFVDKLEPLIELAGSQVLVVKT